MVGGWPLEARDVGDAIVDLLALGWRVTLKTHLVPAPWSTDKAWQYRERADDPTSDAIGFVASGYSYGPKRDDLGVDDAWRSSGVGATPQQAMTDLILHLGRVDPAVEALRHRPR